MNAGLSPSDLPPDVRDAEIDLALAVMRKRLALYRVNSFLNALPAAVVVTPSSASTVAGAFHMEHNA